MNIQILPVLACSLNDAVQAEALCDYMALLKNKQPTGYLLLAFNHDVHAEMQTRIRIAAEIGFETVDVFVCPKYDGHKGKAEAVNYFFQKVAGHLARTYKLPYFWFEPDCVPLTADWLQNLSDVYCEQPKLYMGSILSDAEKRKCIGRVGVYPRGAAQDLQPHFEAKHPFEIAAGEPLVAKTSKTRLIQMLPILDPKDREKVRPDAVLLHGDKSGILLSALRDEAINNAGIKVKDGFIQSENDGTVTTTPTMHGFTREQNIQLHKDAVKGIETPFLVPITPLQTLTKEQRDGVAVELTKEFDKIATSKVDGRTKAGRAARGKANA